MPIDREVTAPPPGDEGTSLLEVLLAIFVIGTVMTAVAPFLVTSVALSNRQRTDQAAIQIANDGIERVRAVQPKYLVDGRGKAEAERQWDEAPPKVKALLDHMELVADTTNLPASSVEGAKAPLPTKPVTVTVNGITYSEQWYVGQCWQAKVTAAPAGTPAPTSCDTTTTTGVPFYRVVVSVEWTHAACPTRACAYVASVLISKAADPTFDTNRPPPKVTKVPAMVKYVGDTVEYQLRSSGGRLPLTWTATPLPPGLTIDPDAGLIRGVLTKPGTYKTVAEVTDKDKLSDDTEIDWTVADDLTLTTPATPSPYSVLSRPNTTVSLSVATAAGGVAPLTWTADQLPTGLAINPSSGLITGRTPTTPRAFTTTVRVADAGTRTRSTTFTWYIASPLTLQSYAPPAVRNEQAVDYQLKDLARSTASPYAFTGLQPYRWSAENLPDGLTIDPATGQVTGTLQSGTQYLTRVTVTDSANQQASVTVVVSVTTHPAIDLKVVSPTGTTRSTPVNTTISPFTATFAAAAHPPPHTWTATDLPPGISMTPGGTVSGRPTVRGTWRTVLMVRNTSTDERAYMMFDWTVT